MGDGVGVFFAGLSGVFLGMACLYLSIKMTGRVIAALESKQKAGKEAGQGGEK